MKQILLIGILGMALVSCDPVYGIYLENDTYDTATITATTNIHFHVDSALTDYKELGGPYNRAIIEFKLTPKTKLKCGSAIAGLENEVPFETFEVKYKDKKITANTKEEILELFDKKLMGGLKTPYKLTIK